MKKAILFLVAIFVVAMVSCNAPCQTEDHLTGKWKKTEADSISYVLELTETKEWKYYKNGELLEEGAFVIEENIFVMKHKDVEHDHDHEDEHYEHKHADDHKYEFSLNEDFTELSFITEEKTSKFIKMQ